MALWMDPWQGMIVHTFLLGGCLVKDHDLFDHFLQEDLGRGEQDMS